MSAAASNPLPRNDRTLAGDTVARAGTRRLRRLGWAIAVAAVLAAAPFLGAPPPAEAMCAPLPCELCTVENAGQVTFVVLHPDGAHVTVIPNIFITGDAADFALLVPTPVLPELAPADAGLWPQLFDLTRVASSTFYDDGGLGCDRTHYATPASPPGDGVDVLATRTVGDFDTATLSGTDPSAIAEWITTHGYAAAAGDLEVLGRYVERGWVFTVMKPTAPADLSHGINVDPVAFTFAADSLEVPLDVIGLNRTSYFPVYFAVVADHRMTLPGFLTTYANRVNGSELAAIRARYPAVAARLAEGRFLTRLDRVFTGTDSMDGAIALTRATTDDEYRRSTWWEAAPASFPGALLLLFLLLGAWSRGLARRYGGAA